MTLMIKIWYYHCLLLSVSSFELHSFTSLSWYTGIIYHHHYRHRHQFIDNYQLISSYSHCITIIGSSRNHWEYFDEAMKTSDKWIHTLLAHFKQQYASTRKQLEKQHRLLKMASGGSHETASHKSDAKSPRESKGIIMFKAIFRNFLALKQRMFAGRSTILCKTD